MTTEEDFQAALDADPTDRQTRLVLADFLEERGDPRAAGYRALGELRIYPFRLLLKKPVYCYHGGTGTDPDTKGTAGRRTTLPRPWFRACFSGGDPRDSVWLFAPGHNVSWQSGRRAVEDLAARAWAILAPDVRDGVLRSGRSRVLVFGGRS